MIKMADEEEQEPNNTSDNVKFPSERSARQAKKNARLTQIILKNERNAATRLVSGILKKAASDRTTEELEVLSKSPELTSRLQKLAQKRDAAKSRHLEVEDPEDVLQYKCQQLAEAIKASNNVVVYTGAGISTAASIPDYRGPNGVWTLLQKGQQPEAQDLSDAEPTLTHMSITQLYIKGHVKHVVSQNCDGLHLRSGFPRQILSEVHGNMYIEVCTHCKPQVEHIRLFDVTEKTGVRRHSTDRSCHICGKPLKDTIVHFGEKGGLKSPYRWKEAAKAANNCDIILCLGTSLKILKKYPCLWCMDRRLHKRPKLFIVNLQWTPKDDTATLKINGRCDEVMKRVLEMMRIPILTYNREDDPIFSMYSALKRSERLSTTKKILKIPNTLHKRKNRKPTKELVVVDVQKEEALKEEKPMDPMSVNCTVGSSVPVQPFVSPTDTRTGPPPLLNPNNGSFFPPLPTFPNGTNQLPLMQQFLNLNALILATNIQQMSNQLLNSACEKCKVRRDLNCRCMTSLPQGLGVPLLPGLPPFLPFLPQPSLLDYPRLGMPAVPPQWLPSTQGMFQSPMSAPSNSVRAMLNDHCYLNKAQMQKLSPQSNVLSPPLSQMQPPRQNKVKMTKSSENEKSNHKIKVESSKSSLKRERTYPSSVTFSLESPTDEECPRLGMSDPGIQIQDNRVKEENQELPLNSINKDKSWPSVITKDNLTLERSVSEQLICDKTKEEDDEASPNKKRKIVRSTSVPGWFGKGLNLKKKRRV
ncbi:uncharacterized protein LOC133184300 [Saccostrea echinata]|uniref:uncharacterized protein LOC133184300 n=1 Tax=Saccostrea echinata TaxID=191078 RepID=UPI002A80A8C7|nr:uncharacterized protein LOC133184300 [Saccostrea echinata]